MFLKIGLVFTFFKTLDVIITVSIFFTCNFRYSSNIKNLLCEQNFTKDLAVFPLWTGLRNNNYL